HGWIMLAVKARSIDVTKEPSEIYKGEVETLKKRGFTISEVLHLEPYDKAHAMVIAQTSK
ncbi:MAG: fibrillarin-like rRNA/tRNA 2'-O-methyltransferase, partial [Candidatus Bathyarchaeota archaeon]|nr:fibrillarin-like rRNA/tRNA 2'-O-methyltransferase [Candidatus Bathyarchaeota archaeon]